MIVRMALDSKPCGQAMPGSVPLITNDGLRMTGYSGARRSRRFNAQPPTRPDFPTPHDLKSRSGLKSALLPASQGLPLRLRNLCVCQ